MLNVVKSCCDKFHLQMNEAKFNIYTLTIDNFHFVIVSFQFKLV